MFGKKTKAALLLLAVLCLFCSCREETVPTEPVLAGFNYSAALADFAEAPLDVSCTLSCALPVSIERTCHLTEADGAYTVTDEAGEVIASCAVDADPDPTFKAAGYVVPLATTMEEESDGVYKAHLTGSEIRAFLLYGSNLFEGYFANEGVDLADGCLFTLYTAGDAISAYSYEFTLNITDGADSFSADVKYYIEVKK